MESKAAVKDQPLRGGTNRWALEDIGNLVIAHVVDSKPQRKISCRPITRRFAAQLLAKAQAAVDENNKALAEVVNGIVAGKNCVGTKAVVASAEKRVTLKEKTKTVKIISPNAKAVVMKKSPLCGRKTKRTGKSYTSVLAARSKAACGIGYKLKEKIVDIDSEDADNELAAMEYVEDIYKFYKLTESDARVDDYMGSQPEICSKNRAILIDWLIEVHKKFKLMPESLYLSINIMDRFLSTKTVPIRDFQLVGISSMLIACKYEEISAPQVSDFLDVCGNAYAREQILATEKSIMGTLEWHFTTPTIYVFLVRFIKASIPADKEIENMAFFLAELGLLNYSTVIHYCPSKLAASAVYAARVTLSITPPWTATLKHYTGYHENQITDCAKHLVGLHSSLAERGFEAVCRKYSSPERCGVALFSPAASLLPATAAPSLSSSLVSLILSKK
nr:G2/mitotic-specific cyclin S13-7-like [Ipomoea batatas]